MGRMNLENYLKIKELKDRHLYSIMARNAKVGVWNSERKSFIISRFKFKQNFLDEEFHWDIGSPYGTAKPIREIEQAPDFSIFKEARINRSPQEVLDYLNKKEEQVKEE